MSSPRPRRPGRVRRPDFIFLYPSECFLDFPRAVVYGPSRLGQEITHGKRSFPETKTVGAAPRIQAAVSAAFLWIASLPVVHGAWAPGLFGGYHTENYTDFAAPPVCTNVYADAHCTTNYSVVGTIRSTNEVVVVNGHATVWSIHRVWTYWGQIYLKAGKTEIGAYIDDRVYVEIDGVRVLDGTKANCQKHVVTIERSEDGWHDFKLGASNASAGGGPASNGNGFGGGLGFYIREEGETRATYPADDGTMSRFRHDDGTGFSHLLRVSGTPVGAGDVIPPYGLTEGIAEGQVVSCSAPASVDADGIRATCAGYSVGTVDATTGAFAEISAGTANEVDYRHGDGMGGLVWKWTDVRYRVTVSASGGGSVSASGGWYAAGTPVTVKATPAAGKSYVRWGGGVPAGKERDLEISFPVTRSLALTASFEPVIYVSPSGDDSDGASWATAYRTLERALDAAIEGETIRIGEGRYVAPFATWTIDKAIRLEGVGEREKIILTGDDKVRVLKIDHPEAVVSGLVVEHGYGDGGAGLYLNAGVVSNCVVRNCSMKTSSAAGVMVNKAGLLTHSVITNNLAHGGRGGGVYVSYGSVMSCLIAHNGNDGGRGGGISSNSGKIRFCTIVRNECDYGGGVHNTSYASIIDNNIIYHNRGYSDETPNNYRDLASCPARYNCTYPTNELSGRANKWNFEGDPLLAADGLTLLPGSPCIGAGGEPTGSPDAWDAIIVPAVDLFGRERGVPPCVGAAEYAAGAEPICSLSVAKGVFLPDPVLFTVHADGFPDSALRYDWDFDGDGTVDQSGSEPTVSVSLPVGAYRAKVRVTGGGCSAAASAGTVVYPSDRTIYVSKDNAGACFPYGSRETAAPDIQTGLDAAIDGMTVLVADGLYEPEKTLTIRGAVRLKSAHGFARASISGGGKIRPLWVDNQRAVVEGFTIRDGNEVRGQNVYLFNGTLLGCHVTACSKRQAHGAICSDQATSFIRVLRCIIDGNVVTGRGPAGIYQQGQYALIENCLIAGNIAEENNWAAGGGIQCNGSATIRNCTIVDNHSPLGGAGIDGKAKLVENCIVSGNARIGDGADSNDIQAATIRNCCVYPAAADYSACEGMVFADPRFKNPAKGNWRIRGDSPCVDAGIAVDWPAGAVDLDGGPRIHRRAIDLGCYASVASLATLLQIR